MKSVLCLYADVSGCGQHRVILPYTTIDFDINYTVSNRLEHAWDEDGKIVDAVLIQRPDSSSILQFSKEYQSEGGKIIVEVDDDLFNIPVNNSAKEYYTKDKLAVHREMLMICDYIHCSTPELKKSLRQEKKTIVFPNSVDLTKYVNPFNKQYDVMWSGSQTHKDSLDLIRSVIYELLDKGFSVCLMSKKEWLESMFYPHDKLTLLDFIPFDEYYKAPSMAKVFLTPLPDNKFSESKSELKVIEAAAWGVPSISSNVAPYQRFNKLSNGGNVIIKREKFKCWIDSILQLLEDDELHKEKSELSLMAVKEHYDLKKINKQRSEWWRRIL